jgi:hypothetical protein
VKKINWQISLAVLLILLSTLLYCVHFQIFGDAHHIFIYLLGDVAFVPIEVLLVTVIIHQLLDARDKKALLKKMNMVIGTFFSEVGTDLLKIMSEFDTKVEIISENLIVKPGCTDKTFKQKSLAVKAHEAEITIKGGDLQKLKDYLIENRAFLMRLLENQNLLEHDSFTDLLWALFHLTEELAVRKDLMNLSENDTQHIEVDFKRVYLLLISEWLDYMKHLKKEYPFLFSFAMRTNPFDVTATPIFK